MWVTTLDGGCVNLDSAAALYPVQSSPSWYIGVQIPSYAGAAWLEGAYPTKDAATEAIRKICPHVSVSTLLA